MQRLTDWKKSEHGCDQLLEKRLGDLDTQQADALHQSGGCYKALFDQLPVGVYMYDRELKIVQYNDRVTQALETSYDRIIGLDMKELKDQCLISAMRKALEGEFCHEERFYEATNGAGLWLSLSFFPMHDADGNVIGGMAMVEDVTERRQAEEKLRESEQRFRLLVESVKDYAIFMLDTDGTIVSWNAGAEYIMGYKSEEIIGKHLSTFYPEEDIEHGRPQHNLGIAVAEGRYEDEGWRVRKDGSKFWANVVITALRDEYGNLRGFSKVTRDLTERRKMEEERLKFSKLESVGILAGVLLMTSTICSPEL